MTEDHAAFGVAKETTVFLSHTADIVRFGARPSSRTSRPSPRSGGPLSLCGVARGFSCGVAALLAEPSPPDRRRR